MNQNLTIERSFTEIESALHTSGQLVETFKRKGASLTERAQGLITAARSAAELQGMSRQMIATIEAEGAKAVRS